MSLYPEHRRPENQNITTQLSEIFFSVSEIVGPDGIQRLNLRHRLNRLFSFIPGLLFSKDEELSMAYSYFL